MERRELYSQYFNDSEKKMIKREAGFTLVELMITMVVFVFFIAAASQVFTGLLTQFKQQSKMAETNIEGIVGLEMLRQDIGHAGYGLPWNLNGASYLEIVAETLTPWIDRDFNDGPPNNPARGTDPGDPASNPPAGIRSGNGYALNGSDVLIIKAINVARNDTCKKSTTLMALPLFSDVYNPRQWTPASENLVSTDKIIVLSSLRTLILNGSSFSTNFINVISSPWPPTDPTDVRIVYGVDPDTALRMPFNRADYYVRRPTTMPNMCAPNTGTLYKATVNNSTGSGGGQLTELPLLDCVADMQVIYALDNNENGDFVNGVGTPPDGYSNDISTLTALQIRTRVKEVRVYVLVQEGQKDPNYTYPNSTINVGEFGLGSSPFNLATRIGNPEYKYYRWKAYTLIVEPNNLTKTQ